MRRTLVPLCLALLSACSGELASNEPLFAQSDMSGSLSIPLDGRDAQGHSYRLRGATFEINGSAMMTLTQSTTTHEHQLKAPLPGGSYQVFLRPGFQLVEIASDGSQRVVAAKLSSNNPRPLQLMERGDRALPLSFKLVDSEQEAVIAFGPQVVPRWAEGSPNSAVLASAPSTP